MKSKADIPRVAIAVSTFLIFAIVSCHSNSFSIEATNADSLWTPPSLYTDRTVFGEERQLIMYGEDLIANTAAYLGPKGSIFQISNGMNCQNCHLDAGRRPWANNFATTFSQYPKLRGRSGVVENITYRINDCFQRSMNGQPLDTNSREMQAMYAYIKWVGKDVKNGEAPTGAGSASIPLLNRAADPLLGEIVYTNICKTCHGADGGGLPGAKPFTYTYPPLWGADSYNDGAGLYRLGSFANYVKSNMPYNEASHASPVISTEDAWDVAAYVNSQPRPHKPLGDDYKNLSKKPADFPFGPYADTLSETRHKYGPYTEMN